MPRAKRYVDKIGRGASQSHLLYCDDGHLYVTKFSPNPHGPKVLVNELMGNKLAKGLGIEVLESTIIEVPQDFIDQQPELKTYRGGMHCGNLHLNRIEFDVPPTLDLRPCENREDVIRAVVFDTWVDNTDRGDNTGNILLYREHPDQKSFRICLIDHGGIFTGPVWSKTSLKGAQVVRRSNFLADRGPPDLFDLPAALERLERMDDGVIKGFIQAVPAVWWNEPDDPAALEAFLVGRRSAIRKVLLP